MTAYLYEQWLKLLEPYAIPAEQIQQLWQEILMYYTKQDRTYHNLQHLHDIFTKLETHRTAIHDLPALQFAIWYHDIIYRPMGKKNEEKSALLSVTRLEELGFDGVLREKVFKLIYSTKHHQLEVWERTEDQMDNAYLLDLDLSILGSDRLTYQNYLQQVRKEYKLVPNFLYKRGRKKVLLHFLEQKQIFKTKTFLEQYEARARANLAFEIGA